MAFVVDNSVVMAWLSEHQATDYTRRLSTRARREAMHAPAVWPLELANALVNLERRGRLRSDQADVLIAKAQRLGIIIDPAPLSPAAILAWSRRSNLAAYDAAYLELASRAGWPLATRDTDQRAAAQRLGIALA